MQPKPPTLKIGAESNFSIKSTLQRHPSVSDIFHKQVEITPEAPALLSARQSWTYAALNAEANQLAHGLIAHSIGKGSRVAILAPRGPQRVIAILAVLKTGAAYLALDPAAPGERHVYLVADARADLVIHSAICQQEFATTAMISLRELASACPGATDNPEATTRGEDPAYLCYTSGTSGPPKAAVLPHRAVVNLVTRQDFFDFSPHHVWLELTAPSFDPNVLDLFGPLLNGAALAMLEAELPTPEAVGQAIDRHGVTTIVFTTAVLHALIDLDPGLLNGVHQIIAGGEVLSKSRVQRLLALQPELYLANAYGPTETCVMATSFQVTPAFDFSRTSLPIGKPLNGVQLRILNRSGQEVSPGAEGELYLGGPCVALGYWQRPELSDRLFQTHVDEQGEMRYYRTGDRVRLLEDGNLAFVGRVDGQLKIRGQRIEPGEVAAVIESHADVTQAIVAARTNPMGEKALVAWVVSTAEAEEIIPFLGERLPEALIPSAIVKLARFPLTANRKIDQSALPNPIWRDHLDEPPQGETERQVADVWCQVLGLAKIGRNDRFTDLGGHSLFAAQASARLRESLRREIPLSWLLTTPCLSALAARLDSTPAVTTTEQPFQRIAREGLLPLSFAQERVWFIERLNPHAKAYKAQATLRMRGKLDLAALERSLSEIVARHEIFRTTFTQEDGPPFQVIHEPWQVTLPLLDLHHLPEAEREAGPGPGHKRSHDATPGPRCPALGPLAVGTPEGRGPRPHPRRAPYGP